MDHKYLGSLGVQCWRKMEKISWTNNVRNEVLQLVKGESNILQTKITERLT